MLHYLNKSEPIFNIFKVKTDIQIACEPHDLNMDLVSFDNGF